MAATFLHAASATIVVTDTAVISETVPTVRSGSEDTPVSLFGMPSADTPNSTDTLAWEPTVSCSIIAIPDGTGSGPPR